MTDQLPQHRPVRIVHNLALGVPAWIRNVEMLRRPEPVTRRGVDDTLG